MNQFGEDTSLIKTQELYLSPLFDKEKCVASATSLENLFVSLKSLSFKEITDVMIGLENALRRSVETYISLHDADILKQLVILFFRQGSIDSSNELQGTLLRKIMQLFCMIAEFNCTSVDAKWILFPFNTSCRFVIKRHDYLNIFFDSIRELVSSPSHPLDSLYIKQKNEPFVTPPLSSFPSTNYVLSISYCVTSLCSVSAGSGQAVIFRLQSPNYTPSDGGLFELIAVGTTLRIRIVSKGKEDSAEIMNGVQENKWSQLHVIQIRSLKRGHLRVIRNGVELLSSKMVMPSSDVMSHASISVCSEGFIGFAGSFSLFECASLEECSPDNAVFSYACNRIDQNTLIDASSHNLNSTIQEGFLVHTNNVNDSIMSLGGVEMFFPLIVLSKDLPPELRLSHSIPPDCVSRVVCIVTAILTTSQRNLQQFQGLNGISILISLLESFDDACITHDLFFAVKDFCTQVNFPASTDLSRSLLFNWDIWRKGSASLRQYVIDSLLKMIQPGEGWDFFKLLLNDSRCDDLVASTLVFKGVIDVLAKSPAQLDALLGEMQKEDISALYIQRSLKILATALSQSVIRTVSHNAFMKLFVNTIVRFNDPSIRISLYDLCWNLLRKDTSFVMTQDDIDVIVMAYRQLCSFTLRCDELQAILQIVTDLSLSSSAKQTIDIIRPLFLQLVIRLLGRSDSVYARERLMQVILEATGNEKKKQNMKNIKYDSFFIDLLHIVPAMDPDKSQPPSKPSVMQSIRSLLSSVGKSSSGDVIKKLYELDCQEGFNALIHIYKTDTYSQELREQAVDAVFEQCRSRYNGVVNNIRSMLLEYVMKVYVRFSISSMPILVRCINSTPLLYGSSQIITLLYKLSLTELLQMRDLSKLNASNLTNYVTIFVAQNWDVSISQANYELYSSMLNLISRFVTDTVKQQDSSSVLSLEEYAKLLTVQDVNESQIVFPTGCFYYGLWIGNRLLPATKDTLVISELIKSVVFSYQRFLEQSTFKSIVISFLSGFSRVPDLAKTIYDLLQLDPKQSVATFCKSKEADEATKQVDQVQLVFVELQKSFAERANKAFNQQNEQRESSIHDAYVRFVGKKDNSLLMYDSSNRSGHSDKILKARHAREQQLNLTQLHQLIFRIRCNESSVWFREKNRVKFFECSDRMDREGGHALMVPSYTGSSRPEARKRGTNRSTDKKLDMKAMQSLYHQLYRSRTTLSEEEKAELKMKVEMLLKQFTNVSQEVEKRNRRDSLIKGFFKNRRGSDVRSYSFQVAGIRFDSTDPVLNDLSFASFDALQEYIVDATVEKTEGGSTEEAVKVDSVQIRLQVVMVMYTYELVGELQLTGSSLIFRPDSLRPMAGKLPAKLPAHVIEIQSKYLRTYEYNMNELINVLPRNHLLGQKGLELFFQGGQSAYFDFASNEDRRLFFDTIRNSVPTSLQKYHFFALLNRYPSFRRIATPSLLVHQLPITEQWMNRQISTFDYLMQLNLISGRSYHSLSQYPVFPWILQDYTSKTIDLNDPKVYRDLSKPIGALNEDRFAGYLERYESLKQMDDGGVPPFLYGTHYSTPGYVLHYLVRLEPYSLFHIDLQNGCFDEYNRLFNSVQGAWLSSLNSQGDVKELTPEWFCLPDFFRNSSRFPLNDSEPSSPCDVILPPWANDSPEKFIAIQREALESDYVSAHIHEWIDLIWGVYQRGDEAKSHNNLFFYITYVDDLDLQSITDEGLRANMLTQVAQYGQIPSQLFNSPHPTRIVQPSTDLVPQQVFHLHHKTALQSILIHQKSIVCVDAVGRCSLHELNRDEKDRTNFPCTIHPSEKKTKRSVGGITTATKITLVPSQMESVQLVVSFGDLDALARVAWLNGVSTTKTESLTAHFKAISCVAKDVSMFALGGQDCLVSVWKMNLVAPNFRFPFGSNVDTSAHLVQILSGYRGEVTCVAIEPSLQVVAAVDSTCCITTHSFATGEIISVIPLQNAFKSIVLGKVKHLQAEGIQYTMNGSYVVMLRYKQNHSRKQLLMVVRNPGRVICSLELPESNVLPSIRLCCQQTHVLYCYEEGFMMRSLYDLTEIQRIECKPPSPYSAFSLSQDEKLLIAGLEDGSMIAFGL